jgi:hypothetical protein
MQDINESVLLALYEKGDTPTEMKLLAKILLENCVQSRKLQEKVDRYEKILLNRRSIPLTPDEIDEIHRLRLKYNKALKPEDHDEDHNS